MRADPTLQLASRIDAHPVWRRATDAACGPVLIERLLFAALAEHWLADRLAVALGAEAFSPAPHGEARQIALNLRATLEAASDGKGGLVAKFDRLVALSSGQGVRVDEVRSLALQAAKSGPESALSSASGPASALGLLKALVKLADRDRPHVLAGLLSMLREVDMASGARTPLAYGWAAETVCARPVDEPRQVLKLVQSLVGRDRRKAEETESAIVAGLLALIAFLDASLAEMARPDPAFADLSRLRAENAALKEELALLKRALMALARRDAGDVLGAFPDPGARP
jgi:hypothetical protein